MVTGLCRRLRWSFIGAIALSSFSALTAQEFSVLGGTMGTGTVDGSSYAWQLDFRHSIARYAAWSASWINEGHDTHHHRDGLAAQAWLTTPSDIENFSFGLGAGAYHYSDTVLLPGDNSMNVHGWTPIYSLSATYYTDSPWLIRLTANHINRAAGLQTNTLVAGVGYRLGWVRSAVERHPTNTRTTTNEFTVFLGKSVVNTSFSEDADASVYEYRRGIGDYFDWTISWLNEGDPRLIRRNGLASQVWLVDAYLDRRLTLGLGVGPYLHFNRKRAPRFGFESERNLAALISPTASYRFGEHWLARVTWNRVVSDYNRDADVIVLGLGFRWGDPR